ncbi:nicotinate-nucleotide--dimethylbenzimidazole phosphoribosyltransferase [Thiofaba sp. EF100]|jgi:nicotinate-nucleotide--dimethylbenzimidazole phosphoribosyltransferase|uniref:nicotinate-nucleotide--dimethylbenzimidazole phosphoribosyltransferase n=1 Tax=Thiofaba sp. EF100 TaxID=3121274 RepID=UPI00322183D2
MNAIHPLDESARQAALARQARLTKPAGALARLEDLAIRLAAMQGRERPRITRPWISVFAADHGVAAEGVSAYPREVTGQMIVNFARGGAAISVLARELQAQLEVVDVGSLLAPCDLPGVLWRKVGQGTANLLHGPAMSAEQLDAAMAEGRAAVERARAAGSDLFIAGEMGIGNTTSSSLLACLLLGLAPERVTGRGTGVDDAGLAHKLDVIRQGLALHDTADGLSGATLAREALRRVGGFEIAAMSGAYLACAEHGLPAVIDGVISSVAALAAERIAPGARTWWLFGHRSPEPAHTLLLEALGGEPVLDLGLRLGEGSGAATAVAILRLACALHADMATFDEAGVSDKT